MVEFIKFKHKNILQYLNKDPIRTVFAGYVAQKTPNNSSFCIKDGDKVCGCAISGNPFGLNEVFSYWVFCDLISHASRFYEFLFKTIKNAGFYFPLQQSDIILKLYPNFKIKKELYYCLYDERFFRPIDNNLYIVRLDKSVLEKVKIPHELIDKIGDFNYFKKGISCFGLIIENTLISMAEAAVLNSTCQTIQQVYTIEKYRGQSFAKHVVSRLVIDILSKKRIPSYLVDEDNLYSNRIPLALGFKHDCIFGHVEVGT